MNRVGMNLVLALVLMTFMAGSAMAVGTSGDTGTIQNGIFNLGDTVPQGYGEMSIRYRKNATDSKYAFVTDGNTTSITVDTAYDLRGIYAPVDTTAPPNDPALSGERPQTNTKESEKTKPRARVRSNAMLGASFTIRHSDAAGSR